MALAGLSAAQTEAAIDVAEGIVNSAINQGGIALVEAVMVSAIQRIISADRDPHLGFLTVIDTASAVARAMQAPLTLVAMN